MEKIQTKLLKTGIGVHKWCRSSPILNALKVHKIETTVYAMFRLPGQVVLYVCYEHTQLRST